MTSVEESQWHADGKKLRAKDKYVCRTIGYWRKSGAGTEPTTRLACRRRKNGRTDPVDGLGQDSARPCRVVAPEPAHDGQPLPRLEVSHLAGLGSQACADL